MRTRPEPAPPKPAKKQRSTRPEAPVSSAAILRQRNLNANEFVPVLRRYTSRVCYFELFLEADFFVAPFRLVAPFFLGTFSPARRASLKPIAIACFRLFTLPPVPDFSWPCLYSCMTFSTLPPFFEELL